MTACYQSRQKQKAFYIPLCVSGKISISKCAKLLDIAPVNVWRLKKRYLKKGDSAFINGHKGLLYKKKKYSEELCSEIVRLYKENWSDSPFSTFCEALENFHNISIPYGRVRKILLTVGIKPPRSWSTKEKEEHKRREERPREGELVQMDASAHDWFMNGKYETIHGGIDDATHKITGLYMCSNECRLGYNEVLRQTWQNYGVPLSFYTDRHSSFVRSKRQKKHTLSERIDYNKNESTHFTDLCRDLDIEVILALSAQAKGRIERLWQTLQGKLPFIFRFLKIDTIEAANQFLIDWIDSFNQKFAIRPKEEKPAWKSVPAWFDWDYRLSVKFSCRTDSTGRFTFHDCDFRLMAPRRAFKKFELCLSEQFGIRACMDGLWYSVELFESFLQDTISDKMPAVEKDLIARYLLLDIRAWA